MEANKKKKILFTIFLTAFIDMLGIGIIIPVIPAIFFKEDSLFWSNPISQEHRSYLYGLLLAAYPAMQFVGAPILGALSDRFGRKPLLSLSLFGTMLGYLLFGYAIISHDIVLLFISRIVPGFFGGNISIIMSSIADVSSDKDKTSNFGLIGMAFGLGFILGPAIGGILSDSNIVSWFGNDTPFWLTAILTLFNLILLQFIFIETLKERKSTKISPFTGLKNISLSFKDPKLSKIFIIVLLLSLGFTFFTQFFAVYLIDKFEYPQRNIGYLFGWIGIWLAFTQGYVVRKLSPKYHSKTILKYSILGLSISLLLVLLPNVTWLFFIINPLVAITQGITSPNINNIVSSSVDNTRQGEILGINQSMQALGRVIPPLIGGYLNAFNSSLPLIIAAGVIFMGWLGYIFYSKKNISIKTS